MIGSDQITFPLEILPDTMQILRVYTITESSFQCSQAMTGCSNYIVWSWHSISIPFASLPPSKALPAKSLS